MSEYQCHRMRAAAWGKEQALAWYEKLIDLIDQNASHETITEHWETVPLLRRDLMKRALEHILEETK